MRYPVLGNGKGPVHSLSAAPPGNALARPQPHQFWCGRLSFSINPQPPPSRCDLLFGGGVTNARRKPPPARPRWRLFSLPAIEPSHGLRRHIPAGDLRAQSNTQRRRAIIFRSGGVVLLDGRSRNQTTPSCGLCKGRGRWRRVCSNAHFRRYSRLNSNGRG